jgi:hypothetical protein
MENNVQWGVPTQRTKKMEKFNTPVITMNSLAKKGAGRKFQFNKAAVEALGLESGESYITFGFQGDKILVLASADEQSPASLKITKSYSISNKKTYEYIAKSKDLDTNSENYLYLNSVDGQPYMEIKCIGNENEEGVEQLSKENAPYHQPESQEDLIDKKEESEEAVVETAEAVTEDNW